MKREIKFIGFIEEGNKERGFAIVQGETSNYKVDYIWDKEREKRYGYQCSCEHHKYREAICKHMQEVANKVEGFELVKK